MTDPENARTLGDCRRFAGEYLSEHGIEEAKTDEWILFSEITGMKRSEYYLRQHEEMDPQMRERFFELIRRRADHIPVQYLLGEAWCYGNTFTVNEHVLIPRQDTEILIAEAAKRINISRIIARKQTITRPATQPKQSKKQSFYRAAAHTMNQRW